MEQKKLTRQEIEELLPDYIFGRLSPEECEIVESNLPNYPDLITEIDDVRKVFSRLERMDVERLVERKTRNIPVKINLQLAKKKSPLHYFSNKGFITAVAGIGVIIIALSLFFSKAPKNVDKSINLTMETKETPLISFDIPDTLLPDNFESKDIFSPILDESFYSFDENIAETISEIVDEEIIGMLDKSTFSKISLGKISELEIIKNLDKIEENDFQQILEELKDVKI